MTSETVWIQALESQPPSEVTHLEVKLNQSLAHCLSLARAWFDSSPEPLLEIQTFRFPVTLLEQTVEGFIRTGIYNVRLPSLEPSFETVHESYLHVSRDAAWFGLRTERGVIIETRAMPLELPLGLESDEIVTSSEEQITALTFALKIAILHEGRFSDSALEELLHNLVSALEQRRNMAVLAPEVVDGVTESFAFQLLDLRTTAA